MRPDRPAPGDPVEVQRILFGFSGVLAWDVGGNWGDVAERLCISFERVVSFEPADESYQILAEAAAGTPGLEAVQLAVSDRDGEVVLAAQENSIRTGQLTTPEPDGASDSLTEGTWGRILERRSVPCARLDSLEGRYGTPDFIKIDVEGHEVAVIEGGLNLLETARPRLFVEIHNAALGARITDLLQPVYGEQIHTVRHPHYPARSWGHSNHYYLLAGTPAPAPEVKEPAMAVGRRKESVVATRDIDADYRQACIDEYRSYVRAGRTEAAATVAALLRDRYGYDVDSGKQAEPVEPAEDSKERSEDVPEAAVVEPAPEQAVEPKPAPARKSAPRKAPARKTAADKD